MKIAICHKSKCYICVDYQMKAELSKKKTKWLNILVISLYISVYTIVTFHNTFGLYKYVWETIKTYG